MELPAITVCPKVPDAFNFQEMYRDMQITLPQLNIELATDLIRFWLGGSGLENMDDLPEFNRTYLEELSVLYDGWSAGYDTQTFFDLMHDKYGYKCGDLFHYCELGGKPKDCCRTLFHKRPVMRRGICYQTRRNVNQTEADDIGRLMLSLKALPSITSAQYNYIQPQIIIYVNDNHKQVLDFPRFYMYPHEWNRMHFTARLVELLEHPQDCTSTLIGKDANCFVRNWLTSNVIDPYNCTVPYLKNFDGVALKPTCRPHVIAKEYYNAIQLVQAGSVHSQEFEHVKEVYTTSVPGFMSQIGGQFGFFLGLSIITMIQILIYSLTAVFKFIFNTLHCTFSRFLPSHQSQFKSVQAKETGVAAAPPPTPTWSVHSMNIWPPTNKPTAVRKPLRRQKQETSMIK